MEQYIHEEVGTLNPKSKIVRGIFLAISIVLFVTFPILKNVTIIPVFVGVALVIVLIVLAALSTARYQWVPVANILVALLGVLLFEFLAFATNLSSNTTMFFIRQFIALGFLFALYFSVRILLETKSAQKQNHERHHSASSPENKSNEQMLHEIRQKKDKSSRL